MLQQSELKVVCIYEFKLWKKNQTRFLVLKFETHEVGRDFFFFVANIKLIFIIFYANMFQIVFNTFLNKVVEIFG